MPPRRRVAAFRPGSVAVSLVLHGAVLAALLLIPREPREQFGDGDPSYQLVFDGSAPQEQTAPMIGTEPPREQPADLPPPETPPETPPTNLPEAEPALVLPPAPEPPMAEAPTTPEPPPEQMPESAPESPPEPAPASPPSVRLETPPPLPSPFSPQATVPDLQLTPPPPLPPPPARPRPAPRPPLLAQRPPDPNRFPAPIDLNFGPAAGPTARLTAPRGSVASRSIDLSPGAARIGPNKAEAFFDARAARVGADWANGLQAYWRNHRYYPRQAVENGEDGTVLVELVVNRSGKVESVEVVSRSGSPWLDMAALSTWRRAQLAPFPHENTDPRMTITLTINYILLR